MSENPGRSWAGPRTSSRGIGRHRPFHVYLHVFGCSPECHLRTSEFGFSSRRTFMKDLVGADHERIERTSLTIVLSSSPNAPITRQNLASMSRRVPVTGRNGDRTGGMEGCRQVPGSKQIHLILDLPSCFFPAVFFLYGFLLGGTNDSPKDRRTSLVWIFCSDQQ